MDSDQQVQSGSTRERLMKAAVRLGVRDGLEGASIRSIARAVGITEGAVYKHFTSKDALICAAYTGIIEDMARDKEVLVKTDLPFEIAARAWIKLTYQYFDEHTESFCYILLMPHRMGPTLGEVYSRHGRMFRAFLVRAMQNGQIRTMDPDLGVALFSGVVLNIPRRIHMGVLRGPAVDHGEAAADAVIRMFATDDTPAARLS